jgi:hypothetical protein
MRRTVTVPTNLNLTRKAARGPRSPGQARGTPASQAGEGERSRLGAAAATLKGKAEFNPVSLLESESRSAGPTCGGVTSVAEMRTCSVALEKVASWNFILNALDCVLRPTKKMDGCVLTASLLVELSYPALLKSRLV